MQRVLMIGSPGAGKSTLGHALAARTGLPLHHLDRIHWLPGWTERDRDQARGMVEQVLDEERWIIDGNYGSTMAMRLPRADTVIWLDYPTHLCLTRALKRWWHYRGRNRPDMTEGCPERLNLEFLAYVLMFRSNWQRRNRAAMGEFQGQIIRLSNPAEADRWIETVQRAA